MLHKSYITIYESINRKVLKYIGDTEMKDFTLIKSLEEGESAPERLGIKYQQYEIDVDSKPTNILIPLRECENFEQNIGNFENITKSNLRTLLREHRGIIQKD